MDIFEDYLKLRKHTWLRLDGNTSADARQDMLTRFNAPDSPYNLFILSTRAGGLGLNLQVADTVILFDSDWNPHQDLQAQDRAHRIGQKNEVRILRLITSRSIEETILQRAQFKLDMDGKVIQAGKFDNKSSAEEREAFLRALIEGADDDVDEGGEDQAEQNDEELNEVLARSEEEFALFRAMDMERPELDKQDWLAAGPITLARAKNRERLMQDEELPDVYRREHVREDIDDLFDTGRGRRAHKNVAYDDGLTEEQFLNAVESGTLAKRQQRAAVHMLKKRGLDGMSDGGEDESVSQSQMHSEAEDDASSVGTGRKRPRSAAFDSSENEEKLTKKQRKALSAHLNGRDPLEMKDLLPPRIRNKMTRIMDETLRSILDALVVGADGRQRRLADPFWTLPSRKQYPDYYRTTQRPICLETISTRVRYPFYISLEQFKADLDSLVDNACKYNQAGSDIHNDALQLRRLAHAKLDALGPSLVAAATGEEDPSDSDVGSQSKESPQLAAVRSFGSKSYDFSQSNRVL